jgi:hypothetical protein
MRLFEDIVKRRKEFMTLGDLCNEKGELKQDIKMFFNAFSGLDTVIDVYILSYGVVEDVLKHGKVTNLTVLTPNIRLEDIPDYLSKDNFIEYPIDFIENRLEESKENKKNDIIQYIHIVGTRLKVQFCKIKHINYELLNKLEVMCSIELATGKHKYNIDMIEHWGRFNDDDWITIEDMITPRASSLYKE